MLPFNTLKTELASVDSRVKKEFKLKKGSVTELVPVELENLDYYLRPALFLAVCKAYGNAGEKALDVASVLQFIFLATRVHAGVQDDNPDRNFQFPVLVGDYLYGQFFLYLCKAGALEYLAPLSEVICRIHEGGILRLQDGFMQDNPENLDREEDVVLNSSACLTAADLCKASPQDQELLKQFGYNLGVGIAALRRRLGKESAVAAFNRAKECGEKLSVTIPFLTEIAEHYLAQAPMLPQ